MFISLPSEFGRLTNVIESEKKIIIFNVLRTMILRDNNAEK